VVQRGRREPLGVDAELVDAALDEPPRVGLVVDRELARVAQTRGLGAQDAGAGRVESHDPHAPMDAPEQQLDALAHLLRGLVRERDGQDLAGPRDVRLHEPGDSVGEHAGLAGAGAGEHQQRPVTVHDGLALGSVQPGEQSVQAVVGSGLRHRDRGYVRGRRPPQPCTSASVKSRSSPNTPSIRRRSAV
jgi:hypothetical protein